MAGFSEATAVKRLDSDATDIAATYELSLAHEWTVFGKPNGGYVLAAIARAALDAAREAADRAGRDPDAHPHPLAVSAHYVGTPDVGPVQISVEPLRTGRLASQLRARLRQGDRECVEVGLAVGRLDPDAPQAYVAEPPPEVAPFDACERSTPVPKEMTGVDARLEMLTMVDQRLDVAAIRPGHGEIVGWLAFEDGEPWDPVSLLYAVDAFPPATLPLGSIGWAPTLELTAYVGAVPRPGPVRVRQRARLLAGSLVSQSCDVWDSEGRVVAQATQLAAVRMTGVPA